MNDKPQNVFIPFCSRNRQSVVLWQYILHYASDLGVKNTIWDGVIQYVGIVGGASYSFCCPFQGGLKKISHEEFVDNANYAALGLFISMDHAIDGLSNGTKDSFVQSIKSQCRVRHAHVEPEYDYLEDCSDPPEPYDFAFVDVVPFAPVSMFEKSWIQSSMAKMACHRGTPTNHNQKQFILASDAKISEFYGYYSELARAALSTRPLDFKEYPTSFELENSSFNHLRSQFLIVCKWCCEAWNTEYNCLSVDPKSLSEIIIHSKSSQGEISYTIGAEINSPLIELEGWHLSSKIRNNLQMTN